MIHAIDFEREANRLNQPETAPKSVYSKPTLWATILTALVLTIGSFERFNLRGAYNGFLNRHLQIYGIWYTTPHALMHILSFGLLGGLSWLISDRWPCRAYGVAGVLLLGVAIEWLQVKVYRLNSLETRDLLSDAIGVCVGILLARAWSAARSRSESTFTA